MAKTETKTTKATKAVEKEAIRARALIRKGALAYIGIYGAAYDRAKLRTTQLRQASNTLFNELVVKGEELETQATKLAKDLQGKASESVEFGTEKVRSVLPGAASDRVTELEAEIAELNKKLKAAAKKASPAKRKTVKAKMATTKTAKVKAEKPVAAPATATGKAA